MRRCVIGKYVVVCTWSDVPHLSAEEKASLYASIQPFQRDARTKGVPQLGSGAVYPVAESEIRIADFDIPKHWPRGFGMDVGGGAKPTAAAWFAHDREAQVLYLYAVYKRSSSEPSIHATAIKAKGAWIPGVADAAALIMTEHDSQQLVYTYRNLGLDITLPDKSVETGIQEVWELLSTGRLKIFASCVAFFEEFRLYRRDDKGNGKIVKSNDHLQDSCRYFVRSGRQRMKVQPVKDTTPKTINVDQGTTGLSWMGG